MDSGGSAIEIVSFSVAMYRNEAHSRIAFPSVLLKTKVIFTTSLRRLSILYESGNLTKNSFLASLYSLAWKKEM